MIGEKLEETMENQKSFAGFMGRIQKDANVKTAYGDPIEVNGRTIIPVAKVFYGLGGGQGGPEIEIEERPAEEEQDAKVEAEDNESAKTEYGGYGGGGGLGVFPMGYVEILPEGTQYVDFHEKTKYLTALIGGVLAGISLALLLRSPSSRKG